MSRRIERIRVDLDTREGLAQALDGCEWVFHAAGYYPPMLAHRRWAIRRSVETTRHLLEHVRRAQPRRLVLTSSAATIHGGGPRAFYAAVKQAIEQEVIQAARQGLPAVIVNPTVCLGEYDAHRFSGQLILLFAKYRLPCSLGGAFNAVYTGDVGIGHVRAAERGRCGERYVLTCRHITLRDFAALVAQAAGVAPPRWHIPWVAHPSQPLDGTKAVHELSLPQTPIEEAVRRALSWFRAHGDL